MSAAGLESAGQTRQPHIDGLRAWAILAIVVFHAAPGLAPGGFVGVDVFFVISGFLITGILASEMGAGGFSFGRFYLRRARRILPALVVMAAVVCAVAYLVLAPKALKVFGGALGASVLFVVNVLAMQGAGYFEPPTQAQPLAHLWSLAVGEQFYLAWPGLLLGMTWSFWRGRRAATLVLLVASLAAAEVLLIGENDRFAFFMLPTRAWEFLAGAILTLRFPPPPTRAAATGAVVAGLGLILAAVGLLSDQTPFPGFAAVPPVLGAALVLWGGGSAAPWATAALRWRPVVLIGLISYSLYLWHWPVLVFARLLAGRPLGDAVNLALVAACLPVAWASWRFVEQPWRAPGWRPSRLGAVLAAGSMAALFGVGAAAYFGQGLPARFDPRGRAVLQRADADINPWRRRCLVQDFGAPPRDCRSGAAALPVKVVVWGDSHADALTPGVFAWARDHGLALRQMTMGGCPPLTEVRVVRRKASPGCAGFNRAALDAIAHERDLKLIVLAARWPLYMNAAPKYDADALKVTLEAADGPAGVVLPLSAALDRTLTAIAATGTRARVVVVGPAPELTFSAPVCEAMAFQLHRPVAGCRAAPAQPILQRARPAEAEIAKAVARHRGVAIVTPTASLCRAGRCAATMGDRPIYFDDDHLSASGARALAPAWLDAALGVDGWTDREGLAGAKVVPLALTRDRQDLRLVRAAARVRIIPEARADYVVRVEGPGADRFRIRVGESGVLVDGGARLPGALRCQSPPRPQALPLVTIRAPRDVRIDAGGATYGEVGASVSLSLSVKGCGQWRAGPSATDLAILTEGAPEVQAERVNGRLTIVQDGPGRILVAGGLATETVIQATGRGRVRYGGDAGRVVVDVKRGAEVTLDDVAGMVEGSNDGSGRLIYKRPTGQRFCGGC